MTTSGPRRGSFLRVVTGTRPGLERLLLGVFPAIVAGSLGYFLIGRWAGLALGVGVLVLVVVLSRGVGDS